MTTQGTGSTMLAVIARYPSMDDAREATLALESRGVDEADIRLAGPSAAAAETRMKAGPTGHRTDRRLVRYISRTVVVGALVGAALGALAGLAIAWLVVVATDVDSTALAFAAITAPGALLGATLGAFVSFERSVGFDDTWEVMLDDVEGDICIAVRVDGQSDVEHVVETLQEQAVPKSCELRNVTAQGAHRVAPLRSDGS